MRHRHGRAEQVAPRPDRLADHVTPVENGLEIEMRDGRTGRADVVRGGDRPMAAVDERSVHGSEAVQDAIALPVETRRGSRREHGVALELDHREVRLDPLDHGVQEGGQDRRTRPECRR